MTTKQTPLNEEEHWEESIKEAFTVEANRYIIFLDMSSVSILRIPRYNKKLWCHVDDMIHDNNSDDFNTKYSGILLNLCTTISSIHQVIRVDCMYIYNQQQPTDKQSYVVSPPNFQNDTFMCLLIWCLHLQTDTNCQWLPKCCRWLWQKWFTGLFVDLPTLQSSTQPPRWVGLRLSKNVTILRRCSWQKSQNTNGC